MYSGSMRFVGPAAFGMTVTFVNSTSSIQRCKQRLCNEAPLLTEEDKEPCRDPKQLLLASSPLLLNLYESLKLVCRYKAGERRQCLNAWRRVDLPIS